LNQVILLKSEDAKKMASIHSLAFPHFFLTALGKDVLEVFYASLLIDDSVIAFGIKKDQSLVGFFVASTSPKGLYTRVFKRNIFRFILPLSFAFIKDLRLLRRMLISLSSSKSHNVPNSCTSSLLSICVSPECAGMGLGKMLLSELESQLKVRGKCCYYLTTDAENNDLTNQFYKNNAFELCSVFWQDKRKMNLYTKVFL
jgi:ribosomal protein S18 acetylase RimI-like enzyme